MQSGFERVYSDEMELSPEFNIHLTFTEPGTVNTDLREDFSDKELLKDKDYGEEESKLKLEDIANALLYSVSQSETVNINELMISKFNT